tara:strand:- start:205 stop:786 length:582 start_codon:yes stop_codon:yes gene_type:complete
MIKYILFFVAFRFLVQSVSNTYNDGTPRCRELLSFARETELESARDAYCFEAVQEDQRLTLETLSYYKLGFLATNATYAYDSEVLEYACRVPWYVYEPLEWTAGVTPLAIVWLVYTLSAWLWNKRPKPKIKPVTPPPSPDRPPDRPPMDRPARPQKKPQGIRKRKEEKSLMANLNKLASLSPKLRNRIMGEDV